MLLQTSCLGGRNVIQSCHLRVPEAQGWGLAALYPFLPSTSVTRNTTRMNASEKENEVLFFVFLILAFIGNVLQLRVLFCFTVGGKQRIQPQTPKIKENKA